MRLCVRPRPLGGSRGDSRGIHGAGNFLIGGGFLGSGNSSLKPQGGSTKMDRLHFLSKASAPRAQNLYNRPSGSLVNGSYEERPKHHDSVFGGHLRLERAVGGFGLPPVFGPDLKGPMASLDLRVRGKVGLAQPEGQSVPHNLLMMFKGILPRKPLPSSRGG